MKKELSVQDVLGVWVGDTPTGLIRRCKDSWTVPLTELSDLMVATYLNQKIATTHMLEEAERRITNQERDDSELFEGQLQESVERAKNT